MNRLNDFNWFFSLLLILALSDIHILVETLLLFFLKKKADIFNRFISSVNLEKLIKMGFDCADQKKPT